MTQNQAQERSAGPWRPTSTDDAVVRYQTADLDRGIEFYTSQLGFRLEQRAGPVAIVSRGALHLILSAPESSGSRPMADGQSQEPGG
jgi:glyoxylase I family protein